MKHSVMKLAMGGVFACSLGVPLAPAQASAYNFQVLSDLQNGLQNPGAGVVEDGAGDIFSTTYNVEGGSGAIFELAQDGTITDVHSFAGGSDGDHPRGDLVSDGSGNLYGTTYGDTSSNGTVFEIAADGTYSVLYAFQGGDDGAHPAAGLLVDQAGDLYGTTYYGGSYNNGTIFELPSGGTETVLYQFTNRTDGAHPESRLIADANGNLYGTTAYGSQVDRNCGTAFQLAPNGTLTTFYSFGAYHADGCSPKGGLVADAAGNFYGTTYDSRSGEIYGTLFKLAPGGAETILHAFRNRLYNYAAYPDAALTIDAAGNLYGTTEYGGSTQGNGFGSVFELSASGKFSVLHSFDSTDGANPQADLYIDQSGNLFGTTFYGGTDNNGTVFELSPE